MNGQFKIALKMTPISPHPWTLIQATLTFLLMAAVLVLDKKVKDLNEAQKADVNEFSRMRTNYFNTNKRVESLRLEWNERFLLHNDHHTHP